MPVIAKGRLVVTFLSVFWICLVGWFEYFKFTHDGNQCAWPDSSFLPSKGNVKPHHILVIADPQVLDHRSYPERGFLLSWLTQVIVKINMRKNWMVATSKKPDSVIFLGDMLDGGRHDMSASEYEGYVKHFNRIFYLDPAIPKHYIPGNHDTGLGMIEWFSDERYTRYKSHFGKLNYQVEVANHTLVFIDAPGLVDEETKLVSEGKSLETWKPTPGGTLEFISKFKKGWTPRSFFPIFLFTAPMGMAVATCVNEGRIHSGTGIGYQNTLSNPITQKLLLSVVPGLIFSGDDHDYCQYTHFISSPAGQPAPPSPKEISVKSFSMAMGIKRPGFQLLSLAPDELRNPNRYKAHDDSPCFLPDQLGIYLRIYLPAFVLTLLLLFITDLCCWGSTGRKRKNSNSYRLTGRRSLDVEGRLPTPVSASYDKTDKPLTKGKKPVWPTLFFCFYPRVKTRRHNACMDFILDIRDIALYPLSIFIILSYWYS
ncbi:Metallo-dependent phosphatase-like protein [Coprinopsis sp. MPI-PUGE-AT-0042]|nr:Metallo-dependent phosphatase-like protein [Coprinopsis sp. MPI-PUGE-AT-0042]